jgi:DNA modification methylase
VIIHCPHDAQVKVDDLKPHPKNRNKHSKEQIKRLAKILDYQGWRYPIKVSNLSGYITSGHGRLEAAKHLGWKEVPVSYQDYLDEAQEYADVQSDNSIASWAELDLAGINSDLTDLGPDFDIDLLGIKDFVLELAEKLDPQCDEDKVPDALPEPKVVKGEVYILGNHRLMCGDSTAITDVERLMDGEKADVLFTDPPYGYKYESNHQSKHSMLMNDDQILDFMPVAYSALSEDAAAYVCGSHQTIHLWRPLFEQNFTYKNLIVWKKNNWSMGDLSGAFGGQHEIILFGHKGRVELRGNRSPDVWEFDRDPPKDHPTQKPVPMISHALEKVSDSKSGVLDLFGGSGSTLIACEKTDRHCFMMELDPHYCGVILDRWQKYTGKKAHREDGVAWDDIKAEAKNG